METYEPITLLHISDTQFGKHHRFGKGKFLDSIKDDLKRLEDDFRLKPQAIVLTGDLTEAGNRGEFESVLEFANGLVTTTGVPKENFAIVPGNHDVYRPNYPSKWNIFRRKPVEPYWAKWEFFTWFFEEFYKEIKKNNGVESKVTFTPDKPYTMFEMPNIKLVVAGLNSTMEESNITRCGEIDDDQLKYFIEQLGTTHNGLIRLAALHHNPSSGVCAKLKRGLCHENTGKIDLIIHGHLHNDKSEAINSVPIFGIGSAAIATCGKPTEVPNQYQIIQILPNRVRRWRRAYYSNQDRWIGDTSIHGRGHEWKKFTPISSSVIAAAFSASPNSPFVDVVDFLETGDAITAINIARGGKTLSSISDNDKYRYFMYKQKYGFFNDEDMELLVKESNTVTSGSSRFDILYIKMLSQVGRFEDVIKLVENNHGIASDESEASALKSGLLRRKAVALAITKGDVSGFMNDDGCDPTRQVTTETLQAIAQCFCARNYFETPCLVKVLESSQITYMKQKNNYSNLQICRYKSALQALFAEAAVLLAISMRNTAGFIRLISAHLLVPRIMITAKAEGYSELLSMIYCDNHYEKETNHRVNLRELIQLAMSTDYDDRMKFMAIATSRYELTPMVFRKLARIFEIIPSSIPIPADWEGLRKFMTNVERDLVP